ncbi:MAG: SUMF1/EgtB/PvdO family nonheme iron enzyme [Gammaproteobacteria bacterium]|nr:SUMF1/EgtB/PvdO family nonheme iron enzyme [Gammaproteobacteria bacterium]MCI0591728.1 SUMF1/EgtB/PvdO family nonheme iron enzyme [Gammaproteobacteria bacterium]
MVRRCVQIVGPDDYGVQYHTDLSPCGWHLGHCVFTETYWIREVLLEQESLSRELKSLYIPDNMAKPSRGMSLPHYAELLSWAEALQKENIALLARHTETHANHPLVKNHYLVSFLTQHYAQHYESIQMVHTQRTLHQSNGGFKVSRPLQSGRLNRTSRRLHGGHYRIGADKPLLPYDNEYPAHMVLLQDVRVAAQPVTNAEYLAFIEADGYTNSKFWGEEGWNWREQHNVTHPDRWRCNADHWYGVDLNGAYELDNAAPVDGISHLEASAFATWADARLPHEYEWEAACRQGILDDTGAVWEWCANAFCPYDGFKAFPYEGYSSPYFDGTHYTLRGGSRYTRAIIKRPTFRNYYQADQRFPFAGLRLVFPTA